MYIEWSDEYIVRNKRLAGVDKNLSGPPSRSYGASLGAAELESGWELPSLEQPYHSCCVTLLASALVSRADLP